MEKLSFDRKVFDKGRAWRCNVIIGVLTAFDIAAIVGILINMNTPTIVYQSVFLLFIVCIPIALLVKFRWTKTARSCQLSVSLENKHFVYERPFKFMFASACLVYESSSIDFIIERKGFYEINGDIKAIGTLYGRTVKRMDVDVLKIPVAYAGMEKLLRITEE